MTKCLVCDSEKPLTASILRICPECSRKDEALPFAEEVHSRSLSRFGISKPSGPGASCGQCVNRCRLGIGKKGLCGLRTNVEGNVQPLFPDEAVVEWYHDPLPTNCVGAWFCPANRPEARGKKNLAIFCRSCSFNCLYCQNWHHRVGLDSPLLRRSVTDLADAADEDTFCACFFGGDPTPQLQHAFAACDQWLKRPIPPRICWETNGSMSAPLAKRMADYSINTKGVVKFDLKAFDDNLHRVLCGASNRNTLSNFRILATRFADREAAYLTASTLLVPGYINAEEVRRIARFIADLDPTIPYSLLAFYPRYLMSDLSATSYAEAQMAYEAAKGEGLERVTIGNVHLLIADDPLIR